MFQFTADISTLNRAQREAIAAFILNFPITDVTDLDEQPAQFTDLTASPEEAFGPVLVTAAEPVVEIDAKGLPWDERIHASSRVKTADGAWRRKRGVDDATAAVIEAELKGIMPVVAEEIAYIVPPPPIAAVPPPPPPAPGPVAVPAPPAPTAGPDRGAFLALVTKVSALLHEKKLSEDDLAVCYRGVGVAGLSEMLKNSHLIPQLTSSIDTLLIAS